MGEHELTDLLSLFFRSGVSMSEKEGMGVMGTGSRRPLLCDDTNGHKQEDIVLLYSPVSAGPNTSTITHTTNLWYYFSHIQFN